MTCGRPSPPRLTELMALADLPLEAVASRAAKRRSPGETWQVTAQRLSDWQNGGHLPKSDQAFDAVIRVLIKQCRQRADHRDVSQELLSDTAWRRWLKSARARALPLHQAAPMPEWRAVLAAVP